MPDLPQRRRRSSRPSSSCRARRRRRSTAAAPTSSARNSARGVPRCASRAPSRRPPPSPVGGRGSPPRSTSIPSSVSMKIVSRASQPRTSAPQRARDVRVGGEARATDADEVELPAREPAQRRASAISSSAISSAASRPREREHRARASRASRAGVGEQLRDEPGYAGGASASGTTTAPPPRSKWRAFSVWWSAVACGYGTSTAGSAGRRELPHGAARPRDGEVGRGERLAEIVRLRQQDVVRSRDARPERRRSRARRRCAARPGRLRPRSDGHLVQRPRAGQRAEDGDDGTSSGSPKRAPARLARRRRDAAAGIGRPTTRYFGAVAARRSRTPGRRGARTARPGGSRARGARPPRSARPGSAAATRRAPSARRRSRRRRARRRAAAGARIRAQRNGAFAARRSARSWRHPGRRGKPGDRERVELVTRLRNQPRLDAVGRPGERHRHAAGAQRLRDCERRPDVTAGSPGRDHAHELRRRAH